MPSSRIRLLATAVAAPLHPALSLAYRLMVLKPAHSMVEQYIPTCYMIVSTRRRPYTCRLHASEDHIGHEARITVFVCLPGACMTSRT